MAKKRVFISFDYDNDEGAKVMLAGQAKKDDSPFDFRDASIKDHLTGDWKEKVRKRMDNIDLVIVLCGESTDKASGVAAELTIAQEKGKDYFLLQAYSGKTCTKPTSAKSSDKMYSWTWEILKKLVGGGRYAHIDQSLGPWDQRPIFKTNVKSFVSLRKVQPPISLTDLQRLTEFFPSPGFEFQLDPAFEPERTANEPRTVPAPDPQKTAVFAILQRFNRVNLLVPIGAPHMWHAAMQSKSCKLTVLGEHYRRLVEKQRI